MKRLTRVMTLAATAVVVAMPLAVPAISQAHTLQPGRAASFAEAWGERRCAKFSTCSFARVQKPDTALGSGVRRTLSYAP
jgi:hypothetical protein